LSIAQAVPALGPEPDTAQLIHLAAPIRGQQLDALRNPVWPSCRSRRDLGFDGLPYRPLRHFQLVVLLEIEPRLGGRIEVPREPEGCVGSDGTGAVQDGGDPVWWNVQRLGKGICRQIEGRHEVLAQDLAGGDRGHEVRIVRDVGEVGLV